MSSSNKSEESLTEHVGRSCSNCWASIFACCSNTKEQAYIKKLEYSIAGRKKAFGVEYLDLLAKEGTTPADLQACIDKAVADIDELKKQIMDREEEIGKTKDELQKKITASKPGEEAKTEETPAAAASKPADENAPPEQPADEKRTERHTNSN